MINSKSQKGSLHVILAVAAVVLIVGALGWVAFSKFAGTTESENKTGSRDHPNATTQVDDTPDHDMSFETPLKTTMQGDCTLTMKDESGKTVLEKKNSTKDKQGQTGCEVWKLFSKDLPKGKYNVEVVFANESEKETAKSEIEIK